MDENFQQNHLTETTKKFYGVGHDHIRLMKWMALYGQNYKNINLFDSLASVECCLNEIF